jgi:hypothetical protein
VLCFRTSFEALGYFTMIRLQCVSGQVLDMESGEVIAVRDMVADELRLRKQREAGRDPVRESQHDWSRDG